MTVRSVFICVGVLFALIANAAAPVSKTAEFHQLGVVLTADKTQDIVLPDGVFLTGSVKDQNGNPVRGAIVAPALTSGLWPAVGAITDATGKFTTPVVPGSYMVYATPPASPSVNPAAFSRLMPALRQNITVTSSTDIGAIIVPSGFILSGNVLGPSGSLGVFSGFLWTSSVPANLFGVQPAQFQANGTSSSQYAVALPAGKYKSQLIPLMAFSSTFQPLPVAYFTSAFTITGDKTLNLQLRKGFHLSGSVRDLAGKPLDGFLWVYKKGVPFIQGVFAGVGLVGAGKYELYLPTGSYTAVLFPFSQTYTGRAARTSLDFAMPAAEKTLNITAINGVILSGKVTDARNVLIKSKGIIMLRDTANRPPGPQQLTWSAMSAMGTVNAKGQYRLVVPPGTYDLQAFPKTGGEAAQLNSLFEKMLSAKQSRK